MRAEHNRILEERAFDGEHQSTRSAKSRRTVSVNTVESPLGWLLACGHLTQR